MSERITSAVPTQAQIITDPWMSLIGYFNSTSPYHRSAETIS